MAPEGIERAVVEHLSPEGRTRSPLLGTALAGMPSRRSSFRVCNRAQFTGQKGSPKRTSSAFTVTFASPGTGISAPNHPRSTVLFSPTSLAMVSQLPRPFWMETMILSSRQQFCCLRAAVSVSLDFTDGDGRISLFSIQGIGKNINLLWRDEVLAPDACYPQALLFDDGQKGEILYRQRSQIY